MRGHSFKQKFTLFALVILMAHGPKAQAVTNWINWNGAPTSYDNSADGVAYATSATGYIVDPATSEIINVTFSGEVSSWSEFNGQSSFNPFGNEETFLGPTVDNLPPAGNFIAITGFSGLTNTLTFSRPVANLLMAIGSMGGVVPGSYQFNQVPTVVTNGDGAWGSQIIPLQVINGTEVYGQEGSGMVQFYGTITSITWTIPNNEIYSVFNVGVTNVPEPSALSLLAVGLGGMAMMRRRRSEKR